MRKFILGLTGIILSVSGFSQITADIGIWGGWSGYMGDIEEVTLTQSSFPLLGALYRQNFNQRVSARAMFLTGPIAAEGTIRNAPWSFDKHVSDLSLQLEINYLRYMLGNRRYAFTSYVTAGIGTQFFGYELDPARLSTFNPNHNKGVDQVSSSVIAATFPFGFGFKFNAGKRMGIGIEYQMRKLFNDKLDDLDDPLANINALGDEIRYSGFFHNTDWTGFLGVHLTYSIYLGAKDCPAYDKKKY
ncbi:MAG TPA: DUF6089 family protein [Prolixibacteraceae bacterium]|nr:DUF6089 family protein [Prolixibacteraceae bacterium]HPT30267.1 DUF6089 family protein [Prolixibacteraceae bacterium]